MAGAILAWAAATGSIRGRVLDTSGQAVPGARVTVASATGAVVHATSDAQGEFVVEGLVAGAYQLSVSQHGFADFKQKVAVSEGQPAQVEAQLQLRSVVQTVMVRAGAVKGATAMATAAQVFQSSQSLRVLDREQINALSPVAGSAQIISIAPGANVTGYGNTGATKNTITLNGIQQGWGGYGGFTTAGALGVTFDGVPVSDAVTGLWQSNMFPQSAMINDTAVTYGPGDPAERGYNNIGGGVEFTPLQPSEKMHFSLAQTLGSYGQKNTAFEFTTGQYDGWSAVLSAGHGSGNSFRVASDGFASPNYDNAFYGKLIKSFNAGDLGFGGYYSLSSGYRPQVLPATNVGGVTLDGTPAGALYSQQSSGFYSTLTYADYNKYDSNRMVLLWSKLDLDLDPTTVFYNSAWFERINRLHNRLNNVYALGPQEQEWNNPFTKTFGDKMSLQKVLPYNTLTFGGSMLRSTYNSRNNFHSLALGGNDNTANIGAKIRSSYWNQEMANVFLQDLIRPTSWLSFTPGIRYLHENLGYSNGVLNDFNFAPGVVIPTHCLLNGVFTSTQGNIKVQSSSCDATETRTGWEPSVDMAIQPTSWLSLYGGFQEQLKTPQLGGGGGLFQGVDPASYHLARAQYGQAGVKAHFEHVGPVANLLFGASYFHLLYADQELDVGLANGDSIAASASSGYQGVNWFLDADPGSGVHLFVNSTIERAHYLNYVVNQSFDSNGALLPGSLPYNNLPVSYVPHALLNLGAYYTLPVSEKVVVQPRVWYQFTGQQTVFDNSIGAPSTQTMPTFGTMNLGVNIPISWFNVRVTALNVLNKQYNQFAYISSGGYFGTPNGGYTLAYPGAPFTAFATVSVHF